MDYNFQYDSNNFYEDLNTEQMRVDTVTQSTIL